MDEAHYCPEAFSPITGRCFQVVSRQDAEAGWPAVTLSDENAPSRFRHVLTRIRRPAGRSGPLVGQQPESEAIGTLVGPPMWVMRTVMRRRLGLAARCPRGRA
jgi:hypothetical protein